MPLEVQPKGWYVQRTIMDDGTVVYEVLIRRPDNTGEVDSTIVVDAELIWPFSWIMGPFEKRLRQGAEKAQRRAWQLNRQRGVAHQIAHRIENDPEVREAQANPHDDASEDR